MCKFVYEVNLDLKLLILPYKHKNRASYVIKGFRRFCYICWNNSHQYFISAKAIKLYYSHCLTRNKKCCIVKCVFESLPCEVSFAEIYCLRSMRAQSKQSFNFTDKFPQLCLHFLWDREDCHQQTTDIELDVSFSVLNITSFTYRYRINSLK